MTLNGQPVLSRALAEMAVAQPRDGVAFLAQWLKVFAEQEEAKAWREKENALLKEERAKTQQILEAQSAKRKVQEQAKKDVEDMFDGFMSKMNDAATKFEGISHADGDWLELVQVIKKTCGVEAVYLASLEEAGTLEGVEGAALQYDCASSGSEWMTEKLLKEGAGVTWQVLEESPAEEAFQEPDKFWWRPAEELLPVPEPADGEEPVERPRLKNYPVHVPCVTDVDKVHYFDMTRLGAYLAVPLIYNSYYTPEAFEDALKFEEEKKAEATARKEAEEEKEKLEAEGAEIPEELAAKLAEPVETKELVLREKVVKKVLCLDTLGTNSYIDENKIPQILALCNAVGACRARNELQQVDDQAIGLINEETRTEQTENLKELEDEIEPQLQEEKDAEEAEKEEEEDKVTVQKKYECLKVLKMADPEGGRWGLITSLKSWVYASPEVCNTILAAAMLLRYPKEDVYPRRKSVLQWEKLKHLLNDKLFEALKTFDACENRKGLAPEHKLSSIKALLPAWPIEEEVKTANPCMRSPGFDLLLRLVQAAVQHRTAHLEAFKAKYNRRKEAAEAEGEEFKEPAPQEVDDDHEEA